MMNQSMRLFNAVMWINRLNPSPYWKLTFQFVLDDVLKGVDWFFYMSYEQHQCLASLEIDIGSDKSIT